MAKCFIIAGRINKKYILLLVACLIQIVYSIITIFGRRFLVSSIDNTFINCLSGCIGQMLVGLYPLILKVSNEQKTSIKITKTKKVIHYSFLCLIFGLMTFVQYVNDLGRQKTLRFSDYMSDGLFQNNNLVTFCSEMVFLILVSAIFLQYKYFNHHIISSIILILIGIGFLIVFIGEIAHLNSNYVLIFTYIPYALIDAMYRCYQKYMMEKLYYPYWNIAFVPGIICFPIALFLLLNQLDREYYYFDTIKSNLLSYIFFKIVSPIIYNFIMCPLTIMIVYYFSPDYSLIITLLSCICETINFNSGNMTKVIIFIILCIIQIFFIMIYLEILELNFWGLNKNTKRNIHLRSENDLFLEPKETIYEGDKIDLNKNYLIELEQINKEDIKNEEEQEDEKSKNP